MKVVIFSESPADDTALHLLAQGILGRPIEVVATRRQRTGGFGAILSTVQTELVSAHYNTDADGLIVAIDTDDTPPHLPDHDREGGRVTACRACQLLNVLERDRPRLRQRPDGSRIRYAIASAVPAIEAWYRCSLDIHSTEARFIRDFNEGRRLIEVRRQLKRDVYGTDRPSLTRETECAEREARRLAADLAEVERHFPLGFGLFARMLRAWLD